MTLTQILILSAVALAYSILLPARLRGWFLMIGSIFAVYWLQPGLPIRYLDFILPTATVLVTVLIWSPLRQAGYRREDYWAIGITVLVVLVISLTRYLIPELRPTPSRPPDIVYVLLTIGGGALVLLVLDRLGRRGKYTLTLGIGIIIAVFVVLKLETLTTELSAVLRSQTGQSVNLADASDIQWLGFSYVAFRLIHLLRDRQTTKLPALTLREHLTYVIFFPSLTAGPIDRAERFIKDFRGLHDMKGLAASRLIEGVARIVIGVFKKFGVADTLALIALNETNAGQITSTWGMWVVLYLYGFRLFFDFSGYSDIAIGLGYLFGIRLPENFDRPYLKTNITTFWQSWHMTLSNWVRFYVFFPVSRILLNLKRRPNPTISVLIAQLSTMIVIGMWHGITVNFFIWGVWHGVGLFIHKYWSDRTRQRYKGLQDRPRLKTAWTVFTVLLTFHFVMVGWVWFSLADFEMAHKTFLQLFGV